MATVEMADGSTYEVKTLLGKGDSNAKLNKSDKSGKGYLTVGLSLSPAKESGYEVCSSRSPGCTDACLFTSGHGAFEPVKLARIAKTRLFFQDRQTFMVMLVNELEKHNYRAKKQDKILACRLNVVSDLQWEKMYPLLFNTFNDVQFYDYTKHYARMIRTCPVPSRNWPSNYHLTFSRSETNDKEALEVLRSGGNVTVVFHKVLPAEFQGYKVINGDETDLRFLDPINVVVGLKAKGRGRKDKSGFVVSLPMV